MLKQDWILSDKQGRTAFTKRLLHWHRHHNTRSLPWKGEADPYKIWLSEILLQQTRAEQGLPYYYKFVTAYPTVQALAAAADDEAYKLWEGLGYYARCRNMLATSRQVAVEFGGSFPQSYEGLLRLKGVGPYTAAAIASFAFGLPHAVVDGNVYRVLARYFGITTATDSTEGKKLFQSLADDVLDRRAPAEFNQAIMDHGATICTPALPKCDACPVADACIARRDGLIDLLPVRAKKAAVRPRYFNYLLIHFKDSVWIHQRSEKDIWQGLYEPLLIESIAPLDRKSLQKQELFRLLKLNEAPEYEGCLSQRLTHQLIHSRFFSITIEVPLACSTDGFWAPLTSLKDYAFPRSLVTFFEKKGYF